MITGKYGKPIPPPGCIWEQEPIILYSELAEAYDKGWAVFESFTSDSLGREVTSQFTLERVGNAMVNGGRRFVCEQPVNVMSPPQGLKPFPNKQMVYIGKGPLPEDKRPLSEDEDPLWYYGQYVTDWGQCWYVGDSETAHYAVDPTTQYAREHWPEHVAARERAMEAERRQKRAGGDAIMYPSDSIMTLSYTTYKDPRKLPEGAQPLPEDQPNLAYIGLAPLPEHKQVKACNMEESQALWALWPDGRNEWTRGVCGTEALVMLGPCHLAVDITTNYAERHFPELVHNMQTKRAIDKFKEYVQESMQSYIGQRTSKELQDNIVRELTSFVPKAPWEQNACGEIPLKGTEIGSWYNWIIPGRNIGKTVFVHQEYLRQMEKLMQDAYIPLPFISEVRRPNPNKTRYEDVRKRYPLEKPRFYFAGYDQGAPEVTAETIKLPARPEGMPDHLIYLGEGPLPHERQRLMPHEWKYCHGLYGLKIGRAPVSKFGSCCRECDGAFKGWHYALDPHSTYAYKYWPELYMGKTPRPKPITPEMVREASSGCYGSSALTEWQSMMVADGLNRILGLPTDGGHC